MTEDIHVKKVMATIDNMDRREPHQNFSQKLDLDTLAAAQKFVKENDITHADSIVKEVCPIIIPEYGAITRLLEECKVAEEAIVKAAELAFANEYRSGGQIKKESFEKEIEGRFASLVDRHPHPHHPTHQPPSRSRSLPQGDVEMAR